MQPNPQKFANGQYCFARASLELLQEIEACDGAHGEQHRAFREQLDSNWRAIKQSGSWLVERSHSAEMPIGALCVMFAAGLGPVFQFLPHTEWYSWAERLVRTALEFSCTHHRTSSRELRRTLSYVLKLDGRFDEALPLALLNLDEDRRQRTVHPAEYIESLYDALELYDALCMPKLIEPLCREVIDFQAARAGNHTIEYADALFSLACHFLNSDRETAGKTMLADAESIYCSLLEASDDWTGHAARRLAAAYQVGERARDAETVYRKIVERGRARRQLDDDAYADVLKRMSALFMTQEQWGKAEAVLHEFLDAREAITGQEDATYAGGVNDLAAVYAALERPADAIATYEKALPLYESTVGRFDAGYLDCLVSLAGLYEDLGHLEDAETTHRRAIDLVQTAYGPDHLKVAEALLELAFCLRMAERDAEARPVFELALAIRRAKLGDRHYDVGEASYALACVLESTGSRREARERFGAASAAYEASVGTESEEYRECIQRLQALDANHAGS
jgi:tetratricopeptide (TPR) repeat protein